MVTYCTAAELNARAGLALDDGTATRVVETASRAIDRYCGRRFYADTAATQRLYIPRPDSLRIWVDDISTTSGLVIETDDQGNGTFATTWALSDVVLEPLNQVAGEIEGHPYVAIRAYNRLWPWPFYGTRPDRVRVTAKWGWTSVPAAVRAVCIELAARAMLTPAGGLMQEQIGGYLVRYKGDGVQVELHESEMEELSIFRRLIDGFG